MKTRIIQKYFHIYWYPVALTFIILLSLFLRFYSYDTRFALAGDQARDAIVARVALHNRELPLLGPFSSAGNFTTGIIWYIWLIFSTALAPGHLMIPWLVMSLAYVGVVCAMILAGYKMYGKPFSLLTGLVTAFSPAQITQSLNLTNPSLVAIFSALSLLGVVYYVSWGSALSLFLLTVSISLAISTHFQAVYLLFVIPVALILRRDKLSRWLIAALGLLIPTLPYFIVDAGIGFYNLRGIADFLLFGQNNIYIANRWLTYITQFIPQLWNQIVGGYPPTGYIVPALALFFTALMIHRKKIKLPMLAVLASVACIVMVLRYYKGERYFGYFVFLQPYILIISAWVIRELFRVQKILGILALISVIVPAGITDYRGMTTAVNITYDQARYWAGILMHKFPGETFDLYTPERPPNGKAISLVLYLDTVRASGDNGHKIGFGITPRQENEAYTLIRENTKGYELWDLGSTSSAILRETGWYSINPNAVYNETTGWYKQVDTVNGFQKLIDLILSKH